MSAFLSYLLLFAFSPGLCFVAVLAGLISLYVWVCLLGVLVRALFGVKK